MTEPLDEKISSTVKSSIRATNHEAQALDHEHAGNWGKAAHHWKNAYLSSFGSKNVARTDKMRDRHKTVAKKARTSMSMEETDLEVAPDEYGEIFSILDDKAQEMLDNARQVIAASLFVAEEPGEEVVTEGEKKKKPSKKDREERDRADYERDTRQREEK